MTVRIMNLVAPLSHKDTDMRLTAWIAAAYIPARQQTTDGGLGGPIGSAAISRMVLPCGYFFALVRPLNGRAGRGGRKACRLLNPVRQPRPVPLTLLGGWVRGSFNEPEFSTMTTSAQVAPAISFAPNQIVFHHSDQLLSVLPDIDASKALETASLWLAQSRDVLGLIAKEYQHEINDSIYGAITLLELAKGLIDHIDVSEVSHG